MYFNHNDGAITPGTLAEFGQLKGQTCKSVEKIDDSIILFTMSDGRRYALHHFQNCCESVEIESIVGDLNDLVGTPILMAEESSNQAYIEYSRETWTFYKLATIKGYVDIRWHGESNGYYSESVDFSEVQD